MIILQVHGALTTNFKVIAQLKKFLKKVECGDVVEYRCDCFKLDELHSLAKTEIAKTLNELCEVEQYEIELNYPMDDYQCHVDQGGISYIIPLQPGTMNINGCDVSVSPYVVYSFDDGLKHNTNFPSIMIKPIF